MRRDRRRVTAAAAVSATALVALGGCGGGGTSPVSARNGERSFAGRPCPGASLCPYARVISLGRRGEGVLRAPEAVAIGPRGNVYVGDQFSHVVQRFSPSGRFRSEWGSYGAGAGQFGAVGGLAVDAAGNVYALDSTNDRIEKFSPTGRFLAQWGRHGRGLGEFDFNPGLGPDMPPGGGIAVAGRYVYVADTLNNRVQRFHTNGTGAIVWAGQGSGRTPLSSPRGMLVDGGNVYVADDGDHRVVELDSNGRLIHQIGTSDVPGGWGNPFSIALSGASLFVVDDNNGRIVRLSRDLRYQGAFSGSAPYQLSKYIRAVTADSAGHLYVADTGNYRMTVYEPSGRALFSWGVSGNGPGQFVSPLGVATDGHGRILVVQTYGSRSPIYVFDSTLAYQATWSRGGGAILGHSWFSPTAAAVAPDGSVWVTDRRNDLVRHLSSSGRFLGALGSAAGTAALQRPIGVAVAANGDVYVADTGNRQVKKFSPSGRLLGAWSRGQARFVAPVGVAVGPQGQVYVADAGANRIVELRADGSLIRQWGSHGRAAGQFLAPSGIAVDAHGNVFVADRASNRVQRFTAGGRYLAMWGTPGTGLGQFNSPSGLSIDCRGDVLVADTRNNRVQLFSGAAARCSAQA